MRTPRCLPLIVLALFAAAGCDNTATPAPVDAEVLPDLPQAPVRVVYDEHGIPHIYGQDDNDVLYGQGYAMAELRPAQSELVRLRAQGRRAEIWGEERLSEDLFVRAMDFHGYAERNWEELAAGWPAIAEGFAAFAQGINARYAEYRRDGWPSTMQVLRDRGYEITDWRPVDVFAIAQLMGFGLSGSPDVELLTTIALPLFGPDLFEDLLDFAPPATTFILPDWNENLPAGGGELLPLTAEPPPAPPAGKTSGGSGTEALVGPLAALAAMDAADLRAAAKGLDFFADPHLGGSNNMGVLGRHTASGAPIVESDTHQGLPNPAAYVLMHLISSRNGGTGSQDVIGAAFPGVPTVVFGHNGRVVWTPTIAFSDLTDFYIEFTDPKDSSRVLRPGGSLPTTERMETFKVRRDDGGFDVHRRMIRDIPGHGPILPGGVLPVDLPIDLSVRWAGAQLPGPTAAVHALGRANDMDDLFAALRQFVGGTISFIMGTTEGDVAFSAWTRLPKRGNMETFKPWFAIPGSEGPHWRGYVPPERIPYVRNPAKGYVWTANNDPVGNTADGNAANNKEYYGFAYSLGYRAERLEEYFSAAVTRSGLTMDDMATIQTDRYSNFAADLRPYLLDAVARRPDLAATTTTGGALTLTGEVVRAIADWDLVADRDSFEASFFYAWAFQFTHDFLGDDVPLVDQIGGTEMQILARPLFKWLRKTAPIIDGIDAGTVAFPSKSGRNLFDNRGTDRVETRDELILDALHTAVAHIRRVFEERAADDPMVTADDITTYRWDRQLRLRFEHELAELDPAFEEATREFPAGGNFDTVNVGHYTAIKDGELLDQFVLSNAPSNRFLYELKPGGIETRFQQPSGQSEIPESDLYLNLAADYAEARYRSFPYSDAEIDASARRSYVLD